MNRVQNKRVSVSIYFPRTVNKLVGGADQLDKDLKLLQHHLCHGHITEEAQGIFQKALEDVINARPESGKELSEVVEAIQKEEGRPFCAEWVGLLEGCIGSLQHHRKN